MSTLSQLGLIIYILSLGEALFCFFHILTHALFKSLLFLRCGGVISHSFGNQDYRRKGLVIVFGSSHSLAFCVSSLRLVGFPFLAGFFSKDLCLDSLLEHDIGFFSFGFFFFGCVLTAFYSFRIFFFGLNSSSLLFSSLNFSYSLFSYFYFILIFFSIVGGKFFGFLFLVDEVVFSFSLLKFMGCLPILLLFFFLFFKKINLFWFFFFYVFNGFVFWKFSFSIFFFKKIFFLIRFFLSWDSGPFWPWKGVFCSKQIFSKFWKFFFFF